MDRSQVVEAGVHPPGLMRRHADRVLPVYELIVVQSGVLPIAEDDRRFAVPRDGWVLLRAGHRHYGYDDMDRDAWFHWLCFGAGPAVAGTDPAALEERRTGSIARPERLRALFEYLLHDQQAGILTPAAARGYLQLVLAEVVLEGAATGDQAAVTNPLAVRAASFIADHLTERDLSTARIAHALAFNADYLGRVFRDAFGETLTEHIHRLRIDRARMLFRSTDLSVPRVIAEVGFADDRYFRRIFKRRVGLTPGQFQRLRPSSVGSPAASTGRREEDRDLRPFLKEAM